uniref:Vesicle-associated membrane protein 7 n=1 Tax=Phallusia mammillata TaxID=59560 RepID=A0A6F9DX43_9ASCI|nr:vesicle-associated membrane protein 711-like [Phallusia mammillata]
MPLLYSCISRGDVILVDKQLSPGDHQTTARGILLDLSTVGNRKTTLPQDDLLFHTMTESGLVYLCVSDKQMGRRVPYAYLEQVQNRFSQTTSLVQRSSGASAFEFNRDFRNVLADLMDDFNTGKADKLTSMQNQVGEVTNIMKQNVEKVVKRGEGIGDLLDKTDELEANSQTFKVTATKLQRKYFWQNKKMCIIIVVVVLIIIIIIVLVSLSATGTI